MPFLHPQEPRCLTLPSIEAYYAGMKRKSPRTLGRPGPRRKTPFALASPHISECVQYTVRNVPRKADEALRRRADELRVSLNQLLRQALLKEAGMGGTESQVYHDLDAFVGSWQEDPEFDAIIAEQDRIDPEKWG